MPIASTHDEYTRRLLDAVEASDGISQRFLAKELGIALGLTNLLIKRLVHKGWVRVIQIKPNRVKYLITPAGIVEKTRMSRAYFHASVEFYRKTRARIHERFLALSSTWPAEAGSEPVKRIVFYGAGEVAEIGYLCLGETDLKLVAVVDERRTKAFFGAPVHSRRELRDGVVAGCRFDRLVVMSFGNLDVVADELNRVHFPPNRVFWL